LGTQQFRILRSILNLAVKSDGSQRTLFFPADCGYRLKGNNPASFGSQIPFLFL
jgi:hypothetical protein